jgi:hypothetical protein
MVAGGAIEMATSESPEAKLPVSSASPRLRIAAIVLRTMFIAVLLALTVRVSMPQSETIWTAYETPDDLIRFVLGLALCLWLGSQLLQGPSDAQGYRTWLYVGLAGVPFAIICLVAVW